MSECTCAVTSVFETKTGHNVEHEYIRCERCKKRDELLVEFVAEIRDVVDREHYKWSYMSRHKRFIDLLARAKEVT